MTKLDKNTVAVVSSGNGGQSVAAYLAHRGFAVRLYAREQERVDMFASNVFTLDGAVRGRARVDLITCDMAEAICGAQTVLVTTPAQYHPIVARAMAKALVDGQTVVLNPGRTLGTYVFEKTLRECGCTADITLAETETFIFTCRCLRPGHPTIYAIKRNMPVAAHIAARTDTVVAQMNALFEGDLIPARSVLHTDFGNIGMVFHPLPILMNITRVEAKEDFHFYTEGISPLVANIVERLDRERLNVAKAFHVDVLPAAEWLRKRYGVEGDDLYSCVQANPAYRDVLAPTDIDTRYIFEDILTGCVPIGCAGKVAQVDTTIIDSVVQWATTVYDYDFHAHGRNERLIDFDRVLRDAGV